MSYTSEQVTQIIKQQLGDNVVVKDEGYLAPQCHSFRITVGEKPNPAYNPTPDVNSAMYQEWLRRREEDADAPNPFGKKTMPDDKILMLNGAEDYNAIVSKLVKIRNGIAEQRKEMPKFDPTMSAINTNPQDNYKQPEVPNMTPPETTTDQATQDMQSQLDNMNIPQPEPDMMKEVLDAISSVEKNVKEDIGGIAKNVETLTNRVTELEAKTVVDEKATKKKK